MTAQELKQILSNRLINAAAVAVQVLPSLQEKSAKKTLIMKLNGAKYYTLKPEDLTNAATVLRAFAAELKRTNTSESSIIAVLTNPLLKRSAMAERLYPQSTSRSAVVMFLNRQQNRSFTEPERGQICDVLHELSRTIEACFELPKLPDEGGGTLAEILNGGKIDPNIFAPRKRTAG